MQTLPPGDAQMWTDLVERLGVVGMMALVILAIVRQWFAPWYVVTMLEKRVVQLEQREQLLLELALKGASVSQAAVSALKAERV
jgi:hypothetical protein